MLGLSSRKYFFVFMYSTHAGIDIDPELYNDEVLISIFVCDRPPDLYRMHPLIQEMTERIKTIQRIKARTPTQIVAIIILFLFCNVFVISCEV